MSRKHNTKHMRGRSSYRLKKHADRYGQYREGRQLSADMVAGVTSYQKKDS